MREVYILISVFCCLGLSVQDIFSQFSGVNTSEFQFGKLPDESADPFVSVYDRATMDYRYKAFKLSATLETYGSPFDQRNYFDLSQLTLSYKTRKWEAQLGNYYETLGRGMLLRSFEIPGAILEDIGFRSRNYFHRDILGGSLKYKSQKWNLQLMHGQVLNNVLPPTFDRGARRSQNISALSTDYKIYKQHKIAVNYMILDDESIDMQHLYSMAASGPVTGTLSYYIEYAANTSSQNNSAFYAGFNGSAGSVNFSAEYKRYDNFIIGNGYNEPPALIKQHTYRTLNRSTHVTNPLNEQGYQIELFIDVNEKSAININHALAVNHFSGTNFTFQEYFLEWSSSLSEITDYKVFVDFSQDPFKGEHNRVSLGSYWDIDVGGQMRILPEAEFQIFDRSGSKVVNHSYSLGWQADSKLFLSMIAEGTSDPFLLQSDDNPYRWYIGSNIRFKPDYKNTFQLFIGERRGGPLCSAGVCYEILDFKGVEVRWTTRL